MRQQIPGAAEPSGGGQIAMSTRCNDEGDEADLDKLMRVNFYDALGTQPGATNAEIRKAFKAAALKHHPDKGGDPRVFRYLSMVRDILLSKAKREQYDFDGRAPFAEAFSKPPPCGGVEKRVKTPRTVFLGSGCCSHRSATCWRKWRATKPGRLSGGVMKPAGIVSMSLPRWC